MPWLKEVISKEIITYFENRNRTYKNLWDAANTLTRWKFIMLNAYIRNEKGFQNTTLRYHLRHLKKTIKYQSKQKEGNNKDKRRYH